MINLAHAQAAAASGQSPFMSLVPFVLVFVVFYFLMIKPQKKKLEEEKKFLNDLKKGDEVFTKSGIIGKIIGMTEKVITLEVSENTKIKFLRSQIAGSSAAIFEKKDTPAKK